MIKLLTLFLFSSIYLFGSGFWTLTGLTKANIYIANEVSSLESTTITETKKKMQTTLHKIGIKTDQRDSPTLMIKLTEIEDEDYHYVYIQLALGEEVQTFRNDKSATFAFTYLSNDFIETDSQEINSEVMQSVDFLLSQFVEQFEDDK